MNLKDLKERKISKRIVSEDFIFNANDQDAITSKKEKTWSYKNKNGQIGRIHVSLSDDAVRINATQDFNDIDFSKKLQQVLEETEYQILEKDSSAFIINEFSVQVAIDKAEVAAYLSSLEEDNASDKYEVFGNPTITCLLELKEQGYIKELYSVNMNKVAVKFNKTEDGFVAKMKNLGIELEPYNPPKENLTLKEIAKFAKAFSPKSYN